MSIKEHEDDDREKLLSEMPETRRLLLKDATLPQIKSFGALDQETLESMIVGFLVGDPDLDDPIRSLEAADKIVEAAVKREWFEVKYLGELFSDVLGYYKQNRKLMTGDVAQTRALGFPATPTEASNYKRALLSCQASVLARNLGIDPVLDLLVSNYLQRKQDEIYQRAVRERNDPKFGPIKSYVNMRETCVRELIDPRGAVIRDQNWIKDYKDNLNWMKDMKENPEKYRGITCGIPEIDGKTEGFRAGQLTVIVGPNGGFKTTCMLNIAFGCFERGANVLYASLEMEMQIVQLKLWARGAKVSWTRCYNGDITEPIDRLRVKVFESLLKGEALTDELKVVASQMRLPSGTEGLRKELNRLNAALSNVGVGKEDTVLIEEYQAQMAQKPNQLRVVNVGQSQKMKMSQLERWLREQESVFKPQIVILDYLDLIEPDDAPADRPDIGIGNICKMSRAMGKNQGFAIVTAAQLKRGAIERIRKTGMENPEKAVLGTDDIAGSSQVGADADNVFILWREQNGNAARMFTAKSRYKGADQVGGVILQVDHDTCTMGANVETTEQQNKMAGLKKAYETASDISNNKPKYQRTPEDFEESMDPGYAPPLVDDGESDMDEGKQVIPPDDKGPDI